MCNLISQFWQALKWLLLATLRVLVSRAKARYGPLYLPSEENEHKEDAGS